MTNIDEIKTNLDKYTSTHNIKKYDMYGSFNNSTSVSVDAGKADKVTAKDTSSCVLRVWLDNKVGTVSTSDLTELGLNKAIIQAKEIAELGLQDVNPDFSPLALNPLAKEPPVIEPSKTKPGELIDTLISMEKETIDSHKAISRVPYNVMADTFSTEFYINSDGAKRECKHGMTYCYLYSLAQEEGKRARKAFSFKHAKSLAELDTKACVQETIDKTKFHLNYSTLPKDTEFTVVFSPRAFLSLFSSFANIWNARSVLDGRSLATKESISEQLAIENFNFSDNALHPDNPSQNLFDQEGTPTQKNIVIQNGVLKTFLHNEETAKIFQTQPTGNATISARPSVSTNYYHIYPTQKSGRKDPEKTENIIYIEQVNALHAGIQATQGTFSLPSDGWYSTKEGKFSFESAVISGDILKSLKNIIHIDDQVEATEMGVCSDIWIEGIKVTG